MNEAEVPVFSGARLLLVLKDAYDLLVDAGVDSFCLVGDRLCGRVAQLE